MIECNSHETHNIYPNLNAIPLNAVPLNDQHQFRLNKINEIKDYFVVEIKERELVSIRLSKHIASFDYFDKSIIVLSATTGSIYVASFATVIGAPEQIASAGFSLPCSIFTGIVQKLLKTTRNKEKKHNKIIMLPWSKLNSIEGKISEALINNEISNEDFTTINEERSYWETALGWWIVKKTILKKNYLIEEGKIIGTDEIIKRNEIINNSLKSKI